MNSFGHIGLTLAVAFPLEQVVRRWVMPRTPMVVQQAFAGAGSPQTASGERPVRFFFDYRLIMIGGMLPDIIDKPLGFIVKPEFVNNSLRTVGHSISFNLALLFVGLLVYLIARNPQFVWMTFAGLGHLVLDEMWKQPRALLWPLHGWTFPRGTTSLSEWLGFHLAGLFSMGPLEYFGVAVILAFVLYIVATGGIQKFLKTGAVN